MRWLHRLFMREERPDIEREQAKTAEVNEVLASSAEVIVEKDRVAEEFRRAQAAMRGRTDGPR